MAILGLDHVQIAIPAGMEAEARAFYRDVLGLREIEKPPNLAARGGLWFAVGSLQFHLGVDPAFSPARKAHPAFLVDDLAELRKRLHRLRPYEDEPLPGFDRFYVSDPFGNRLEFLQRLA